MGAFLDKPKTDKHNEGGSGNGVSYGVSSMQGWRVEMEDAHTSMLNIPELDQWSFFAVFDGHAGDSVSGYCSSKLLDAITSNQDFRGNDNAKCSKFIPTPEMVKTGMRTGFLTLDEQLRNVPDLLSGKDKSGSTATGVMISPTHIFFANCGDSRGLLTRDGHVVFSTKDHKPINPEEKERITNAGGSVMIQRVNGSLAVSRALGDFEYKNVKDKGQCQQLVSPEPEIDILERQLDDEFIVLACDGIWDVMTNEELSDFVTSRMRITSNLETICNQVVDTCFHKGSRDNMSIIIVAFKDAPKVCKQAIKEDQELDKLLEIKVKELMATPEVGKHGNPQTTETDIRCIMSGLLQVSQDIPGLPPGGGLMAKYSTIESVVNSITKSQSSESNTPTTNSVEQWPIDMHKEND